MTDLKNCPNCGEEIKPAFTRKTPEARREQLLDIAVRLAEQNGYHNVTRGQIAEHAKVSPALVQARLGGLYAMRNRIMTRAVQTGIDRIVAQGLAVCDPIALDAPDELKQRAINALGA